MTYGYHVEDESDPFLDASCEAMENFSKSTTPGAFLVDIIPQCKCSSDRAFIAERLYAFVSATYAEVAARIRFPSNRRRMAKTVRKRGLGSLLVVQEQYCTTRRRRHMTRHYYQLPGNR